VSSGSAYNITIQSSKGGTSTVIVPIAASGDTITSGDLLFDIYIDTNGNITNKSFTVSGSNASGSWVKFADGTMECWTISALTASQTGASATGKPGPYYGMFPWVFPVQFIGLHYATGVLVRTNSSADGGEGYVFAESTSGCTLVGYSSEVAMAGFWMSGYAKGKWK
jgi:hypothetical protein